MSLTGALSSAISALSAQSQALAMVSDNIANSDTAGYKTTSALFEQMVTASSSARSYTSGGVAVLSRANITQQGLLAPSTNPADVAIQGAGFFVVDSAATGGTTFFTRNGSFTPDNQGGGHRGFKKHRPNVALPALRPSEPVAGHAGPR